MSKVIFNIRQCLLSYQKKHVPENWVVHINQKNDHHKKHSSNKISTTKYNWYSFLPKGLFEQFRRVANLYFALHAALSLTPITPVNPITTILPLVFVIGVSIFKEAVEDVRRGRVDKEVNNRLVLALRNNNGFQNCPWKELKVGNIVQITKDSFFPADLLFLSSSDENGTCYVETMNIDGETNLKMKTCIKETKHLTESSVWQGFNADVKCELPNRFLYRFAGDFKCQEKECNLSASQVLLRGSKLKNTSFVYGAVIFTGHETKIMLNATEPPSKRSSMEKRLDKVIMFQIVILIVLSSISSFSFSILLSKKFGDHAYLQPDNKEGSKISVYQFDKDKPFLAGVLQFFTCFVLYGYFVPISLYVSMEIVKLLQVFFLNKDQHLCYEENNKRSFARTSNLNEELGEVSTILSDKTGTLTCNEMEFYQCSIAGISYGEDDCEMKNVVRSPEIRPSCDNAVHSTFPKGFKLHDKRLLNLEWQKAENQDIVKKFLETIALCNSIITVEDSSDSDPKYIGESTDEIALVVAAKVLGFVLYKRSAACLTIHIQQTNGEYSKVTYEILATIDYSSARKCMSVIVREHSTGQIILLCKGADNVIFEKLSDAPEDWRSNTSRHIKEYAKKGLRTLALAYRVINNEEFECWQKKWKDPNHESSENLADVIENNLILVGATAIEDRLQEGVPKTIQKLADAGINIWVLSGDKMETAIIIGQACKLLQEGMEQHILQLEDDNTIVADKKMTRESSNPDSLREISEKIKCWKSELEDPALQKVHAIVIDGSSLDLVLSDNDVKLEFLRFALKCKSVICCRVSPKQKALITKLVRKQGQKICLAVGDGANDVGMIQKANIGVGISGYEGQQAVMASDISIPQFRFLEWLLLVHGGWCYKRISFMIKYFLYKNFIFGFSIFIYNALTMFSGQSIYADWYLSLYNVVFTAVPVVVVSVLDQDVNSRYRIMFPHLYTQGQRNQSFTIMTIFFWFLNGVLQAILCSFITFLSYSAYSDRKNGQMVDIYGVGTTLFTSIVLVVNLQMVITIQYWTWIHHVAVWGEIVVWFLFLVVAGELPRKLSVQVENLFIYNIAPIYSFYFIVILSTVVALLPTFAVTSFLRRFYPEDSQIILELEKREHSSLGPAA